MRKMLMVALLSAVAVASGGAGAAGYEMRSYVALDGKTQEAFAWCESEAGLSALTLPEDGKATLYSVDKGRAEKGKGGIDSIGAFPARIGQADPGAGQIYYPISWTSGTMSMKGFIHISNIENTNDPTYRMTHINSFTFGNFENRCRYVPQAAFIGVTNKRTVIVWDNGKTATYATRNFDGTPGVYVTEGKRTPITTGGVNYLFLADGKYTYSINIDLRGPDRGASVMVGVNGKLQPHEPFLAYSVSLPKPNK